MANIFAGTHPATQFEEGVGQGVWGTCYFGSAGGGSPAKHFVVAGRVLFVWGILRRLHPAIAS